MKKVIKVLLLNVLWLFFVPACRPLEEEPIIPEGHTNLQKPKLGNYTLTEKGDTTSILGDSLTLRINLDSLGNLNILKYGVVWSDDPNVVPDTIFPQDRKKIKGRLKDQHFTITIGPFQLNKKYWLWPFVATGEGVHFFKEPIIFMPSLARLSAPTLMPNKDSACSLDLSIKFDMAKDMPPVEYGHIYSENNNLAQAKDILKIPGPTPGQKSQIDTFQTIGSLKPDTKYFIWIYAKNQDGSFSIRGPKQYITKPIEFPHATFDINTDNEIFQDARVEFTTQFNSEGAHFFWNFGDNSFGFTKSPVHVFDGTTGMKNVKLQIRKSGCIQQLGRTLDVIENPFKDYWVLVEGGTFDMGCFSSTNCPANAKLHPVQLTSYCIGKTEVTQKQWVALTKNNPSTFNVVGCDSCPVESITWDWITKDFLPKLKRKTGIEHYLPSEAQWEYAARDRGEKIFEYPGTRLNGLINYAWYDNNEGFKTRPVKTRRPNQLGLYDMSGNVAEICQDVYVEDYNSMLEIDPTGPQEEPTSEMRRVVRGGAYNTSFLEIKVFFRGHEKQADLKKSVYGFRLVKKAP